jgi:hypothetical protein
LGSREFDSLTLGEGLYDEVAHHLQRMRRSTESNYPVYLTGVISSEGDAGRGFSLIQLLKLKYQVEERLAAAMR